MFDEQVTPEEQKPTDQEGQEQEQNPNAGQEPTESWFEVDGRKYNPESASKKISHQDQHISKLEQELAELREKSSKLDKIDQLEELLMQQNQNQQPAPEQQPQDEPTNSFNEEEVESRLLSTIEEKLAAKQKAEAQAQNIKTATEKAQQLYGSEYLSKLEQIGQELGMSKEAITNMAGESPNVFDRLFLQSSGSNPKPTPQNKYVPPRPSGNEDTDMISEAAKALLDKKLPASKRTDTIAALLRAAQN